MGKKDANVSHCLPVDQYRKQIGKQDWKKSKKEIKKMKSRADNTTVLSPQAIVFWMGLVILSCSAGYFLLCWYTGTVALENIVDKPPV
ncbi:triple QxxK/R motif-containing protein [Biomphalaria glabrata]|nr:triple QxxK/R motif-containing protein [Biomphalaria glabrata]